jgi:hypothetical protein
MRAPSCGGLLTLVIVGWSTSAQAELRVPAPEGWRDEVPAAAQERARAWAGRSGRLQWVASPSAEDDVANTLAAIEIHEALDPADLADDARAAARLQRAATQVLELERKPSEVLRRDVGLTTGIAGRWADDDTTYGIALLPDGAHHTMVVLALRRDDAVLYPRVLEDVLSGTEGAVAPTLPFPRGRVRWLAWAAWAVVGLGAGALALRAREGAVKATVMGLLLAAAVVGAIAYTSLSTAVTALDLAHSSRLGMSAEVAGGGLAAAVVIAAIAALQRRRVAPVDSAPASGAYALRTAVVERSSPVRVLSGDVTPASLEPVDHGRSGAIDTRAWTDGGAGFPPPGTPVATPPDDSNESTAPLGR